MTNLKQLDMWPDDKAQDKDKQPEPHTTEVELSPSDMHLLVSLAGTGRDLLRRTLLMNNIPEAHVDNTKETLARADRLLERVGVPTHDTGSTGQQ